MNHNPYPRTKQNGELSYKHRDMAALKLGRRLEPGETVHHINGDKTDFHPENIIVFSSQRAHMLFENYELRRQRGIDHLFSIEEVLRLSDEWLRR